MDWNKYIPFHSCFRVTRNWLPGSCKNYFLTFTISRTDSHRLLKTCILAKINSTSVSTPENFKDLVVMFCMLVTPREWCDGSWGANAFVCAANPTDNSKKKKNNEQDIVVLYVCGMKARSGQNKAFNFHLSVNIFFDCLWLILCTSEIIFV